LNRIDVVLKTIAITGASGFIGGHLVQALLRQGGYRIKVLSRIAHFSDARPAFPPEVEIVRGDLREPASLDGFLEAGCTVINLVYLWDEGDDANLLAIRHLLAACDSAKVSRLVHCSTADVAGRTPDMRVTESSPCHPVTSYALTKLKVEKVVLSASGHGLRVAVLRPTAVFGPGGQNLKKLADDLVKGMGLKNDIKSALFGRRRMNLVYIDNVVAAIMFLTKPDVALKSEIFIVSDDDAPSNEFSGVDRAMRRGFGLAEPVWPSVFFPPWVLSMILRALRKNNVDPASIYDPGKLLGLGFVRPVAFEEGLSRYIAWYGMEYLRRPRKVSS
jgi:nucleoside-diphosphate-sugar epimerase